MNEFDRKFAKTEQLQTERLILRRLTPKDAADMFEYAGNPEVTRYLLWETHPDASHTIAYLQYVTKQYKKGGVYDFAIVQKTTGRMIGTIGFVTFDTTANCGEIGYVVSPVFQRQGIATEAVREVIAFGFDALGLNRIEAYYMRGNDASRAVMDKCKMKYEGMAREKMLVKGAYRDIGCCAILKEDYYSEFQRRYFP